MASDDPYGLIEFQSASTLNVSEDVGFVNLTVVRNGGSIGDLSVNYSVSSTTATQGTDYESFGSGMGLFSVVFCIRTCGVGVNQNVHYRIGELVQLLFCFRFLVFLAEGKGASDVFLSILP